MFSIKIIDSDAFLEMPLSTQALYFHLSMRADDDGFLNNAKKIMKIISANQNDYDLLVAKRFIIQFPDGICVIKHWRINNYLRNDRYKETVYTDEKEMLELKKNGSYSIKNELGIPTVNQSVTQYSIEKDSIEKDSINIKDNMNIKESNTYVLPKKKNLSCQDIVDAFNIICQSYPKVKKVSKARKDAIKARLNTYTPEEIIEVFEKAEQSQFLKGKNKSNWRANFDWLIKDTNMAKVSDGNYDNNNLINEPRKEKPKTTNKFNSFSQREYSKEQLDELEKRLLSR